MRYSPDTHEPTPDLSPSVTPLGILGAGKKSVDPVAAEPKFLYPRGSALQKRRGWVELISM